MTKIYIPEAAAEALSLLGAGMPSSFAENELDLLVQSLPIELRIDPKPRRKAPLGLFTSQKFEAIAARTEAGFLTGESPEGRQFIALLMPDESVLLGQKDPRSGMVKTFPFPLMGYAFMTSQVIAKEFDAWEAVCDAAPLLHLNAHRGPDRADLCVPSWASTCLLGPDDNGKLRRFTELSLHVFCARHSTARDAKQIALAIKSRQMRRDGTLTAPELHFNLDHPADHLVDEKEAFAREVLAILDGPDAPVPRDRQVHVANWNSPNGIQQEREVLAATTIEPASLSAHELIEAAQEWPTLPTGH